MGVFGRGYTGVLEMTTSDMPDEIWIIPNEKPSGQYWKWQSAQGAIKYTRAASTPATVTVGEAVDVMFKAHMSSSGGHLTAYAEELSKRYPNGVKIVPDAGGG